jgi:F0F1-type ATP synthase beta subunit
MTYDGLIFVQIIMQWGQKEEPEGTRGDLRLRGVTVGTSLENNKNKNVMFIILCYNPGLKFLR